MEIEPRLIHVPHQKASHACLVSFNSSNVTCLVLVSKFDTILKLHTLHLFCLFPVKKQQIVIKIWEHDRIGVRKAWQTQILAAVCGLFFGTVNI